VEACRINLIVGLRLAIEIAVAFPLLPKSAPKKFVALKTIRGERIRRSSDAGKIR